jgi:hypothetical protein
MALAHSVSAFSGRSISPASQGGKAPRHQIRARFSGATNILSPGLMPKVS